MRRFKYWLLLAPLVILVPRPGYGATVIILDHIDGLIVGDTVFAGNTVGFVHRLTYTPGDGSSITGFTNGFKVWTHRNGVYTDNFSPITLDTLSIEWSRLYPGGIFINGFGVDGFGSDTITIGGFGLFGTHIRDGFDEPVWYIETVPYQSGDTLCLDSVSNWPPGNTWLWSTNGGMGAIPPDWYGPYCFHVYHCCNGDGIRGDCNGDGLFSDIVELTYLVDYLFKAGPAPICLEECDVNGSGGINIADITYVVDYLYRGGPEPAECP